ncbi:UDP-N-acetylmuramate dehydrogenase [Blastochloris viridis]|uniref:UDP-N-acetylenolpyruvoylglucosamine reductase n=1 Tax=Blastochloris viridis TaxID=1079 RepID=A0A0H5BBP3_BLAVI|nr:UDP-N-acetylmuramate dehydrogenase [Blastochloris viridis]ALK08206.1 UDP-N-acetylenolpyruvoylglucosamine reductase [Blastochloris viridis]BAR98529.1 UDP-N-acetylenolpyruvoylglucosamine reductase [Blastochloris viridis]CUU44128.1 UDP-N-acetylenolpyruvoylglucosamine reductase [Blastochloris viridis]
MSFPDLVPDLARLMPGLRGRLVANQSMAELTWFRVGGPAQVMFSPVDADDLAYALAHLPNDLPVTVVGVGSNLIVRDGGIPGFVIRLTPKGFGAIERVGEAGLRVGAAALDKRVATIAAEAGLSGLEFLSGIPGTIGGALRMNAGAHGREMKDVVEHACAVGPDGARLVFTPADLGFSYRKSAVAEGVIFTAALLAGEPDEIPAIKARMADIARHREESQPVRERTGGSTFKNPPGVSAWKLIDAAGCRGLRVGGAMVSELHCNFLINFAAASASDIEALGETVRRRVLESSGVVLEWEIKRIGIPLELVQTRAVRLTGPKS